MFYSLIFDITTGAVLSPHFWGEQPDELPSNEIECTQAQAENPALWHVVNGVVTASLSAAVAVQSEILSGACQQKIISGFSSSALGYVYTYASGDIDQRNIVQSAQSTKGGLLACQNAAGVWSREPHTQVQSQQVLEDFVTARDAARTKLAAPEAQVQAAKTVEEVRAIVWESAGG